MEEIRENSILDIINEVEEDDDGNLLEDVEMLDVEEGEIVGEKKKNLEDRINDSSENSAKQEPRSENGSGRPNKKKKKKRRNRKRQGFPGSNVTDINRFVLDTCRRLKEKKSYMVYTAVGCLGVSALSELVKEVDAIRSCGGQMTADGRRPRTGGGILWNIIKTREPMAYTEIMKKAKEFEKQFKQPKTRVTTEQNNPGTASKGADSDIVNGCVVDGLDGSELVPRNQHEESPVEGKRKSVHERMRVLVSYDDLVGDDSKNG